ncbi:MAG: peptidase caspase catalytic subunit p20 [Rhizorhabdus sp.]|nr:peptidase caspase catalytic subunit p20 [Rhizorhabdus sp.]
MAKKAIRILCVHGLGDHRGSPWRDEWQAAIAPSFAGNDEIELIFHFSTYDPIFEKTKISFADTMGALWKLTRSGVSQIGGGKKRGIVSDVSDRVRWTAGYVVAWVEDAGFQKKTRDFILSEVEAFKPDVILAHSLGTLITYNAFSHDDAGKAAIADVLGKAHYVTFGSQIGNPFVIGNLTHGRVQPLAVRHWHHLYNEHDDVFTAPLNVQGIANFSQLLTPFDLPGIADHAASGYLGHPVTVGSFWHVLAARTAGAGLFGGGDPWQRPQTRNRGPNRRALLVGINEYPREGDRLEGCVNDVFTMSAVLQECGFDPGEIRTCLDDRATAKEIMSRLEWLVDDARPGDQRVFYYSGHGAQVPEYGEDFEPDRLTETLVPWDFDWSPETCISDEQICALYSQLPYDLQLVLIFDCCHSGSIHRQGGSKARGISPPDDIRHRQLKWDSKTQMWVDRDFKRLNQAFSTNAKDSAAFFGGDGATVKIGRSSLLRMDSKKTYAAARAKTDAPVGPYLPLVIEACGEAQSSYEYRHGATSYGAFTFCLASLLREERDISFADLVAVTTERLKELRYDQLPQIIGPTIVVNAKVPWSTGMAAGESPSSAVPGGATPRTSG